MVRVKAWDLGLRVVCGGSGGDIYVIYVLFHVFFVCS